MYWQIKWAKNAVFGRLPFTNALREAKRKFKPYPTRIPEWTLEEGFRLIGMLREAGCEIRGATVLEIGSGWQPVIPLLFSLAGAARVVTVDMQRLMDADSFAGTVTGMGAHVGRIAKNLNLDESEVSAFLATHSSDFETALQRCRIEYHAPCDLITSTFSNGEYDIVTSRAVLEHVPPSILVPLLERTFRLLRPGGFTCHAVDNSDHWSHMDKRLSRVNFLRYSDQYFSILNRFNPLDYQNRLRHSEYASLLESSGFNVILSQSTPEAQALIDLKTLPLATRFQSFAHEDLARLDSYFVARRP